MKFLLHVPAWLSAAQLPLQVAVLAYVGAGGLVGAAVVGGVMLTPVGEVVREAVAPAQQFVESVVPMSPATDGCLVAAWQAPSAECRRPGCAQHFGVNRRFDT